LANTGKISTSGGKNTTAAKDNKNADKKANGNAIVNKVDVISGAKSIIRSFAGIFNVRKLAHDIPTLEARNWKGGNGTAVAEAGVWPLLIYMAI
jgi:hypothetical protein